MTVFVSRGRRRRSPMVSGLLAALFLFAGAPPSAVAQGPDLQATAQRAQAAMAGGQFDEAARLWAELVEAVPGEPGLRLNLGMALSMAGRPGEAVSHLEAAVRAGRSDLLPASLFLGMARMDLGQPAKAVEPLETFLDAQPQHQEARRMLAEAYLGLGRHEAAAGQYRTLVDRAPEDPRGWYGLGRSYEGVSEEAFTDLQTKAPDSAWILLVVARSMVAQERDKGAFTLYREALEKQPGLADAHEAVAQIYERDGHPEWAAAEREKAEGLPPPDCAPAHTTPECAFEAGRYQAALDASRPLGTAEGWYWQSRAAGELAQEAFAFLDALGPSPEATLVRVQTLRAQKRYAESKEALREAVETWPQDLRIRQKLASLLFIAREFEEARPVLEDLLRHDPESAELNLLLGRLWVEQRQPEKAIPVLEKALASDPGLPAVSAVLGRAYLDAGEATKAIPHLQAGLETDEDGSVHFQLARAYQGSGQTDLARQTRQQFQEIQKAKAGREESEREQFSIKPP